MSEYCIPKYVYDNHKKLMRLEKMNDNQELKFEKMDDEKVIDFLSITCKNIKYQGNIIYGDSVFIFYAYLSEDNNFLKTYRIESVSHIENAVVKYKIRKEENRIESDIRKNKNNARLI